MSELNLSLRQRQLINYLHLADGYTTGADLARMLGTSSRTVRTDIRDLNELLAPIGVQIVSKHRFGYKLEAVDANDLDFLTRSTESYISRPERLRHIALRLALSDQPIDLDEMADEMFISKTTLEHDLVVFRKEYLLKYPYIWLSRKRNTISFENDELKRRIIVCRLYADNWNYNGNGNTLYDYTYLSQEDVDVCMKIIRETFSKYGIRIEDTNMVFLDLMIAIAVKRIGENHVIEYSPDEISISESIYICVDELLNGIGSALACKFPSPERKNIMNFVSSCAIPNMDELRRTGVTTFFPVKLIRFANSYLDTIRNTYHLDLIEDEDFYISLLIYLNYLSCSTHFLNEVDTDSSALFRKYAIEFELAFSIEPFALSYYGNYLDFYELLYISYLFAGALTRVPFSKMQTVILCHYNLTAAWNLRMQIEDQFSKFIHVTALLPVYEKDTIDFSKTDLALVTANKNIGAGTNTNVIRISPWFTESDREAIDSCITKMRFHKLYGKSFPSTKELLEHATWHECLEETDFFKLLTKMGSDFIEKGYADESYLKDLLRRNSLESFALQPSYIIVHSSVPAIRTHIEVATLTHRIRIHGQKIRTIFMFSVCPEDIGLTFKLYNDLYLGIPHPEETRFFKTKEEWLEYLCNRDSTT